MKLNQIHKTHSRNDLIEIIEVFNLDIANYDVLSKDGIRDNIIIALMGVSEVVPITEFPIMDFETLCDFLQHPSPKRSISPDEKLIIMKRVKNIIHFVSLCSQDIASSNYQDICEVKDDAKYIKKYGDLPSVRRALRIFNETKISPKIYPTISLRVQRRLDMQNEIKNIKAPGLRCEHKKIHISFD